MSNPKTTEVASVLVRMPRVLADALARHADDVGCSRNGLVVDVLTAWLDGEHTDSERERIADRVRAAVIEAMGGAS